MTGALAEIHRCDMEIAKAADACSGEDALGAYMGWCDWQVEREMISREMDNADCPAVAL